MTVGKITHQPIMAVRAGDEEITRPTSPTPPDEKAWLMGLGTGSILGSSLIGAAGINGGGGLWALCVLTGVPSASALAITLGFGVAVPVAGIGFGVHCVRKALDSDQT